MTHPADGTGVQPRSADPRIADRGAGSDLIPSTSPRVNNDFVQPPVVGSDDQAISPSTESDLNVIPPKARRRPPTIQTRQILARPLSGSDNTGSRSSSSAESSMSFHSFDGGSDASQAAVSVSSESLNERPVPLVVSSPDSSQDGLSEYFVTPRSIPNRRFSDPLIRQSVNIPAGGAGVQPRSAHSRIASGEALSPPADANSAVSSPKAEGNPSPVQVVSPSSSSQDRSREPLNAPPFDSYTKSRIV